MIIPLWEIRELSQLLQCSSDSNAPPHPYPLKILLSVLSIVGCISRGSQSEPQENAWASSEAPCTHVSSRMRLSRDFLLIHQMES